MVHVQKARVLHPPFDFWTWLWILTEGDAGPTSKIVPLPYRVLRRNRPVFGVDAEVVLLKLGVSARPCCFETLA